MADHTGIVQEEYNSLDQQKLRQQVNFVPRSEEGVSDKWGGGGVTLQNGSL